MFQDNFPTRLRAMRKKKGLTQSQLAGRISRTKQFVSQYERGLRSPSLDVLEQLCGALDCTPNELLLTSSVDDKPKKLLLKQQGRRFTHTDIDLLRLRMRLSPSQRIQSMLNTRAALVGVIRGRLRKQYPDLSKRDLNLKILEEIERAQKIQSRTFIIS